MRFVAADWSMSAPSFAIYDTNNGPFTFLNTHHFYLTDTKKHALQLPNLNVYGDTIDKWETNEERWNFLSGRLMDGLDAYAQVHGGPTNYFAIEGYAFGSHAGSVHQIAENAAVLKHKVYCKGIPIEVINPSTVKKWYSGKGNAKKDELYNVFVEKEHIKLRDYFSLPENQWEPLAGIIDSWILLSILVENHKDEIAKDSNV